jgi:hypothetical protein
MKKTPLAIFTYNRPSHTRQTLEAAARCKRFDECEVVIFCDGLKNEVHRVSVEATREVVQAWSQNHPARIVIREQNLGLKKSIETGVGDLCRQYGRVIVLEDDILVSEAFIDFMLLALDHYENDDRVMQVAGFTFPFAPQAAQGAMLLPLSTTWGWATWERAWQHYNPDPTHAHAVLQDRKKAKSFDLEGAYPYTDMLAGVAEGKTQSWGVLFWFVVWHRGGLVVYPLQSLVQNIGFDGSGVNSGTSDSVWFKPGMVDNKTAEWIFPSQADMKSFAKLRYYIRQAVAPRKSPLWRRAVRKIIQFVKY